MKKNKLRDQDKDKINEIDQDQIMNLLIVRVINYESKNKNKKFNSALKTEIFEDKNAFKFYNKSKNKNKNKSETKLKKSNEMSTFTSDNIKKKKFTYIDCDYCEK